MKVPFDVTFTSRLGVEHTSTVTKVLLNKCFDFEEDGPNGADLALLIIEPPMDSDIAVPTSMVSDDADAVGKEFSFVGWGDYGKAGGRKPPECATTEGGCSQLHLGRPKRFAGDKLRGVEERRRAEVGCVFGGHDGIDYVNRGDGKFHVLVQHHTTTPRSFHAYAFDIDHSFLLHVPNLRVHAQY